MLHDFLAANRTELINRCREKAGGRFAPARNRTKIDHGVPIFLQQLTDTLCREQSTAGGNNAEISPALVETSGDAALHGADLLRRGFTVDEVVRQYGDVCQSITELAAEQNANILIDEFRTLNRCLDDAIADAVTAFGEASQSSIRDQTDALHEGISTFADEHQRLVRIVIQSFSAIKSGNVGMNGATGALLTHALAELQDLGARVLPQMQQAAAKSIFRD